MLYTITNCGCHDDTSKVFELSEEEFEFLSIIFAKLNENSDYMCRPKIYIDKV